VAAIDRANEQVPFEVAQRAMGVVGARSIGRTDTGASSSRLGA
jgi:hypothetical protein